MNKIKYARANILDWVIVTVIVAIVTLGVTVAGVAITEKTYNHRYDADATAAKALEMTISNNKDSASGSVTMSAGQLTYGYFQKSGPVPTKYVLQYKKTSDSSYSTLKGEFTIYSNNDYNGSYNMAKNKYSQKYDVRLCKKSNKSKETVFEIDFGIE